MSSNTQVEALPFRVWFDFPQIDQESHMTFYLLIDQWEYGPYPTTIKTTPFWVEKPIRHAHSVPRFDVDKAMTLERKLLSVWQALPPQQGRITGEMIIRRFKQLPKNRLAKEGRTNGN